MVQYQLRSVTEEDFVAVMQNGKYLSRDDFNKIKFYHHEAYFKNDEWRNVLDLAKQFISKKKSEELKQNPMQQVKTFLTPKPKQVQQEFEENPVGEESSIDEAFEEPEVDLEQGIVEKKPKPKQVYDGEY